MRGPLLWALATDARLGYVGHVLDCTGMYSVLAWFGTPKAHDTDSFCTDRAIRLLAAAQVTQPASVLHSTAVLRRYVATLRHIPYLSSPSTHALRSHCLTVQVAFEQRFPGHRVRDVISLGIVLYTAYFAYSYYMVTKGEWHTWLVKVALGLSAVAGVAWILDTSHIVCKPDSWIQGHAIFRTQALIRVNDLHV